MTLLLFAMQSHAVEPSIDAIWSMENRDLPPPPRCAYDDPIRQVTADIDPSPGAERVVASARFGVLVVSAKGAPLGAWPIGCSPAAHPTERTQIVSVEPLHAAGRRFAELAVTIRSTGRCGAIAQWVLLSRSGRLWKPLLTVDTEVDRWCGAGPQERSSAQVAVESPGRISISRTGTRSEIDADGNPSAPQPIREEHVVRWSGERFEPVVEGAKGSVPKRRTR